MNLTPERGNPKCKSARSRTLPDRGVGLRSSQDGATSPLIVTALMRRALPTGGAFGAVHMSGTVAERLLRLLPHGCLFEKNTGSSRNLWTHVGPRSRKAPRLRLDADLEQPRQIAIISFIVQHRAMQSASLVAISHESLDRPVRDDCQNIC
jgi:hypothetical protein